MLYFAQGNTDDISVFPQSPLPGVEQLDAQLIDEFCVSDHTDNNAGCGCR